jgi:hypothetical protein
MNTTTDPLAAARAAALFASDLSVADRPTRAMVQIAIRHALRTQGGVRGCAANVAAGYGDYPELAARRMRWARHIVDDLYRTHFMHPADCQELSAVGVRRRR